MRKVEYVLFREQLTFFVPRGGEWDYASLALGPDPRYDSCDWNLDLDEGLGCVKVSVTDRVTKEVGKCWLVPLINCRQIRLVEDQPQAKNAPTKPRTVI